MKHTKPKVATLPLWLITLTIVAGILTGIWLNKQQIIPTATTTEQRLIPIYYVQTDEKKLAISFDAAWGCEHTQTILDVLDQYQIKATFFLTNIWLDAYPDMAKTIADHGHEIAMHSVSHTHMPT